MVWDGRTFPPVPGVRPAAGVPGLSLPGSCISRIPPALGVALEYPGLVRLTSVGVSRATGPNSSSAGLYANLNTRPLRLSRRWGLAGAVIGYNRWKRALPTVETRQEPQETI